MEKDDQTESHSQILPPLQHDDDPISFGIASNPVYKEFDINSHPIFNEFEIASNPVYREVNINSNPIYAEFIKHFNLFDATANPAYRQLMRNFVLFDIASNPIYKSFDIRYQTIYKQLSRHSIAYLSLGISTPGFEKEISHFLAHKFNHNTDLYDKVIDAVYNRTHIGGPSLHHNLDGSHTLEGAMKALGDAFPDDSSANLGYNAVRHLFNDLTTPSGINPFLRPETFLWQKGILVDGLGISKSLANDLLNINGAEIIGASVAALSILMGLDNNLTNRLAENVSRLGTIGFISGNPALLLIAVVCLAIALYKLWQGESVAGVLKGAVRGGLSVATFLAVAQIVGGPIFITLIAGIVACLAVGWLYDKVFASLEDYLTSCLESQFAMYRTSQDPA
jgi:hypothetical protein